MHRSTPFARLGRELRHIRQAGQASSNVAHCLMKDKYSKSEPNNNRIGVQVRNIISLFPPKHVLMTTIATINILVQTARGANSAIFKGECRKTYSPIVIRYACSALVIVIEIRLQFHAELKSYHDGIAIMLMCHGLSFCLLTVCLKVSTHFPFNPSFHTLSHSFHHPLNTQRVVSDAFRLLKTYPV